VAVLDAVDERKSFCLCKESNSDRDLATVLYFIDRASRYSSC